MSNSVNPPSVGLFTVIGLIFLAGKLFELGSMGEWPWWLVLLPFWIQIPILVFLVIALAIIKASE